MCETIFKCENAKCAIFCVVCCDVLCCVYICLEGTQGSVGGQNLSTATAAAAAATTTSGGGGVTAGGGAGVGVTGGGGGGGTTTSGGTTMGNTPHSYGGQSTMALNNSGMLNLGPKMTDEEKEVRTLAHCIWKTLHEIELTVTTEKSGQEHRGFSGKDLVKHIRKQLKEQNTNDNKDSKDNNNEGNNKDNKDKDKDNNSNHNSNKHHKKIIVNINTIVKPEKEAIKARCQQLLEQGYIRVIAVTKAKHDLGLLCVYCVFLCLLCFFSFLWLCVGLCFYYFFFYFAF